MKKLLFVASFVLLSAIVHSQNQKENPDLRTNWWGNIDGYINQQDKVSLGTANEILDKNPPSLHESLIRKSALLLIDNVMHEEKAPERPAVQYFFAGRMEKAINEIRGQKVDRGAFIWKLYNHTFIVKTKTLTIGFDIQRGLKKVDGFTLSKDLLQNLIGAVDILFITHQHNDHTDKWVTEEFLKAGKPVISPADFWNDSPLYDRINHPERKADVIQKIQIPLKKIELKTVIYPGHQGDLLNNVYLIITPEGMIFSHTGDQSNKEDFEWIDNVKDHFKVDVLMMNSWYYTPDQRRMKGFMPGLIITGHENELGHTIDHREPYWLNYVRLEGEGKFPWIQMAWGEKYHYNHE